MKRLAFVWSAALPWLLVSSAPAAPQKASAWQFELEVSAGKLDRTNVPVCVPLTVGKEFAAARAALLQAPGGEKLTGQLTAPGLLTEQGMPDDKGGTRRDLHFILPALKAGKSLRLKVAVTDRPPARVKSFSWHDTKGEYAELRLGSRPVLRYMYKALDESNKDSRNRTYKVFHHLYDPAGKRFVTNGGPTGLYPHHRGLFFGFNKVTYGGGKKADVWHCTGDAHQSHEGFLNVEAGPVLGRHRVSVFWHGQGKEVFAKEERELTVYNVPGGTLVEFASRVRTTGGKVHLDGDPQHAGFHFRAANDVADKKIAKQTYYLRPDGPGKPGDTRNWNPKTRKGPVNLPWDAMCFVLGGQRYTVAYLDKPTNPKEARFSERDYGRFGSYFVFDLTVVRPLVVDYRVWLQKGEMKESQVAALDADFVSPVAVTRK
jgi:hypothetical protein